MLKFFFWTLLLANAALLAFQRGAFDGMRSAAREPLRMSKQLNADKIKLIPPPAAASESSVQPAPAAPTEVNPAPTPSPAPPAAPAPQVSQAAPATAPAAASEKAAPAACVEVGDFNPEDASRFSEQLAALGLTQRATQRPVQHVTSYMVYIPPQGDRESAEKKAEELRAMGVNDFFIIQDNPNLRWGISLGVFKVEEAARVQLANLTQKGVRTARIAKRGTMTNYVTFQIRGLDPAARGALEKAQAEFPKQEMHACESK